MFAMVDSGSASAAFKDFDVIPIALDVPREGTESRLMVARQCLEPLAIDAAPFAGVASFYET